MKYVLQCLLMNWLLFSASLPSKGSSSARVTLWRRLQRLGAVTPVGGLYVLPDLEQCLEAYQWLVQETRDAGGEAVLVKAEQFEGLPDDELVARFQDARRADYAALEEQVRVLEQQVQAGESRLSRDSLEKMRRHVEEIQRIDYFHCPAGRQVLQRLSVLEQAFHADASPDPQVPRVGREEYVGRGWVTRPRPHVDRLACAWLIRRYIDPDATIRYSLQPEPDEVPFDMPGVLFSHYGSLCTFEAMLHAFDLQRPVLRAIAEIVHEIDLGSEQRIRQEVEGVAAILQGWLHLDLDDIEREHRGLALFDGLFAAFSHSHEFTSTEREC
jgi:hypothetical protein